MADDERKRKVLVPCAFRFHESDVAMLLENGLQLVYKTKGLRPEQLVDDIRDFDFLVAFKHSQIVTPEALKCGKRSRLKAVALLEEQLDAIGRQESDEDESAGEHYTPRRQSLCRWLTPGTAEEIGLSVLRNRPEQTTTTSRAELLACMLFLICRGIATHSSMLKHGIWDSRHRGTGSTHYATGLELSGKLLGLIGTSSVALALARRMSAFGMKCIFYLGVARETDSPVNDEEDGPNQASVMAMEEERLSGVEGWLTCRTISYFLREVDVLAFTTTSSSSSSTPYLSSGRDYLLDQERIAKARGGHRSDPLFVVGLSFENAIDPDELLSCLNAGLIAGAAFDDHLKAPELLLADTRFVCTPAIASYTAEALRAIGHDLAIQMIDYPIICHE